MTSAVSTYPQYLEELIIHLESEVSATNRAQEPL